ncbi:MAG: cytochrome c [Myxococcales bacterium]|nr:cytochrome c [Myxococcales bacterium]
MHRTLVALLLLPVASGCPQRPYELDESEISDRYAHKMADETCTSWLRSHKTGFLYCASPAVDVPVDIYNGPVGMVKEPEPTATDLDSLMAHGEGVYSAVCVACHQADGQGTPGAFPPLAGSGEYYGDAQSHARIIVHGLQGEITVQGVAWNGVMPPQGNLSNYDIAAVATYERHSWGNDDGIVLPEDVAAVR